MSELAVAQAYDAAPGVMRLRVGAAERTDGGRRTVTVEFTMPQLRALMAGDRVTVSARWEHFA